MTKYKTSKDYEKLYELVKGGLEAVCYIDTIFNGTPSSSWRDKDYAFCAPISGDVVQIKSNVISTERTSCNNQLDFTYACERLNLEWIEP